MFCQPAAALKRSAMWNPSGWRRVPQKRAFATTTEHQEHE
jgi:hypothetical protein